MKKYIVEITETLQRQEEISARNHEEALSIMREKYKNEEIILDESHYVQTDFSVIGRMKHFDRDER